MATDTRWKWFLLALCAVGLVAWITHEADYQGVGGRPWYGFWDSTFIRTGQPFQVVIEQPRRNGATAKAGLHEGDLLDLREQSLDARIGILWQLMATRPIVLRVHRGSSEFSTSIVGSTIWEGDSQWKFPNFILRGIAFAWFILCAILISVRRWWSVEGRILASFLMCLVISQSLAPNALVLPEPRVTLILYVVSTAVAVIASILVIALASRFGEPSAFRRAIVWLAYGANAVWFLAMAVSAVGAATLRIDPLPSVMGLLGGALNALSTISVAVVAVTAVANTPRSERARASWLVLPLPVALGAALVVNNLSGIVSNWSLLLTFFSVGAFIWLATALLVTYAMLNRRVLDVGFIVSRTIVVATVSLIVVMAFVLLEWGLGTFLAGASHATGLIANAALALVLGVSMQYIHKGVDGFVDSVMFRKRYEDERALRDFSKEAAFVTERDALLDRAIENVRDHTDARGAAILLFENGAYRTVRHFGETPTTVDENDSAILALKAWHKPIDPHRYATELSGDLALPMVARGVLLGVVVCCERTSGEAYSPDEIDALAEFSHGVGSALDGLRVAFTRADVVEIRNDIAGLREFIEQRWSAPR